VHQLVQHRGQMGDVGLRLVGVAGGRLRGRDRLQQPPQEADVEMAYGALDGAVVQFSGRQFPSSSVMAPANQTSFGPFPGKPGRLASAG
jgi:hypothetical protein